jgi:hypothetical protein
MPDTLDKNLLYEVERYCNNYFNSLNNPDSAERDYPEAFLALIEEIKEYKAKEPKSSAVSKTVGSVSVSRDIDNSWKKLFARELSIYKRVKFI